MSKQNQIPNSGLANESQLTPEKNRELKLSEKIKKIFQETGETSIKYKSGQLTYYISLDKNDEILVDDMESFFSTLLITKYLDTKNELIDYLRDKDDVLDPTSCNSGGLNNENGEYLKFELPENTSIILHKTQPKLEVLQNRKLIVPSQVELAGYLSSFNKIENSASFEELYLLTQDNDEGYFSEHDIKDDWVLFEFILDDIFYTYALNPKDQQLKIHEKVKKEGNVVENIWKDVSSREVLSQVQKVIKEKEYFDKSIEVDNKDEEDFDELVSLVSSNSKRGSNDFELNFEAKDNNGKDIRIIINDRIRMVFQYNKTNDPDQISVQEALEIYKKNFPDLEKKNTETEPKIIAPGTSPHNTSILKLLENQQQQRAG